MKKTNYECKCCGAQRNRLSDMLEHFKNNHLMLIESDTGKEAQ